MRLTDANGNVISTSAATYDKDGNVLTSTDGDDNVTTNRYDGGRLMETMLVSASGRLVSDLRYTYDPNGNVLTTTDGNGVVMTNSYDGNGNVLTTTDGDGDVTFNVYEGDQLVSTTVGYGTSAAATTTYTYDANGNQRSETDPDGNTTSYTYDANGNVLTTTDENANADMAVVYNVVDAIAERSQAAIVLVHHASKGNQSEKAVTDVGSGAGAISRAADTHMILRRHEEEGAYVLDLALRSWPPAEPTCLRWRYPQWERAPDLDPAALWQGRRAKRAEPAKEEWTIFRLADACPNEPTPSAVVINAAVEAGATKAKAKDLLASAIHAGLIVQTRGMGSGGSKNAVCVSRAPPHPLSVGARPTDR